MEDRPQSPAAFDRLSPAIQYQIVNQLGWKNLRPVQTGAIDAILDDANCIIIAPTAGGKTEAAALPLLSRMDVESWPAASVLYVAPIRALLNNLEPRLQTLTGLVGRSAFVWHGDVSASARRRALDTSVDLIAITPESLEALMLSTSLAADEVLRNVRAVVIDELHAFAGNDRGGHLMALLERARRFAGHDFQRIGLSATIGNPGDVLTWAAGSSRRPLRVIDESAARSDTDLSVDFVGDLENAATVIENLHPGLKRLVFADSRRRVEELAQNLRARGVDTYVSHSSLAVSERRAAERAFAEGDNCVIVATSALELGIDVGDLDHVLQIDAPSTVAAFMQRMGRTGRRPGTRPNCTFLTTSHEALLQAAALIRLMGTGFVEPIRPATTAFHLLAHQMMSLTLQESGVASDRWWSWLDGAGPFTGTTPGDREGLAAHMLGLGFIADVDGRWILGPEGERVFGRRHFQELYAVFSTPAELRVVCGEKDIGMIDLAFLETERSDEITFVLAGHPWKIDWVDWRRGVCHVQPAEVGKPPRWSGSPRFLSPSLCASMRAVLTEDESHDWLSRRAGPVLAELQAEHGDLEHSGVQVLSDDAHYYVWTFFGGMLNRAVAVQLEENLGCRVSANNLRISISIQDEPSEVEVRQAVTIAVDSLLAADAEQLATLAGAVFQNQRLSKFEVCLPPHFIARLRAHDLGTSIAEVRRD